MDSNHRVTGYEPVILPTEVNPHLSGFLKYKQVVRCRTHFGLPSPTKPMWEQLTSSSAFTYRTLTYLQELPRIWRT